VPVFVPAATLDFIFFVSLRHLHPRRRPRQALDIASRTVACAVPEGKDRVEMRKESWPARCRTCSRRSGISRPTAFSRSVHSPSGQFQSSCRSPIQVSKNSRAFGVSARLRSISPRTPSALGPLPSPLAGLNCLHKLYQRLALSPGHAAESFARPLRFAAVPENRLNDIAGAAVVQHRGAAAHNPG